MRYEVVRIAQCIFALVLIGGAFGAGVLFGWARWGARSPNRPGTFQGLAAGSASDEPNRVSRVAPQNLFAPDSTPSDTIIEVDDLIDLRGPVVVGKVHRKPIELGPGQTDMV